MEYDHYTNLILLSYELNEIDKVVFDALLQHYGEEHLTIVDGSIYVKDDKVYEVSIKAVNQTAFFKHLLKFGGMIDIMLLLNTDASRYKK